MSALGTPLLLGSEGGYQISRSVRLRSSASAYFSRTPASATNQTVWTWSAWVKRGKIGADEALFSAFIDGSDASTITFTASDTLRVSNVLAGSIVTNKITTQVFRDPSAWYHIVIASNGSSALNIYVNGAQVTSFGTNVGPTASNWYFNAVRQHQIGTLTGGGLTWYYDGYITEMNWIDGQALTPSSFGETDAITGVWKPKKYAGTYGTNGFYLNFSDNSAATAAAIGKDSSGNGNNWTPNNISVTSGVTYDSMLDVPTMWVDGGNGRGNYAVWNPLSSNNYNTATDGNLRMDIPNARSCLSNISMSSGKWYCEVSMAKVSAIVGIAPATVSYTTAGGDSVFTGGGGWGYVSSGVKQSSGTTSSYGASWVANDIIGIAYDADTGSLEFFKNGTSQGVAFTGISVPVVFAAYGGTGTTAGTFAYLNAGQRPFAYTPPTGFKALNTQNLPDSTIKKGKDYFNAVLYTGNAASQSITGVGFQPDLVWGKLRSTSSYHRLHDALRGADNTLATNVTDAEVSGNGLVSFDADGFTMDSGTNINQAYTYVAWNWKESASAGFDIVTYTGTGASQNVSHSLGVAPKMMITKKRSTTGNWSVYHANLTSYTYSVYLNAANAQASDPNTRGSAPSSSTFNVGTDTDVNANGATYVAYLFAEVAGFSKFGSFTGNGSADGPFIFTGFQPRFIMIKRTDTTSNWVIWDTARDTYNAGGLGLYPNLSAAEDDYRSSNPDDILSNGFKPRANYANVNASGGTYIYAAFASHPFKHSLAR